MGDRDREMADRRAREEQVWATRHSDKWGLGQAQPRWKLFPAGSDPRSPLQAVAWYILLGFGAIFLLYGAWQLFTHGTKGKLTLVAFAVWIGGFYALARLLRFNPHGFVGRFLGNVSAAIFVIVLVVIWVT